MAGEKKSGVEGSAREALLAAVMSKLRAGGKATAADMALIRELEVEQGRELGGEVAGGPEEWGEGELEEWVLRDGIVGGWRFEWRDIVRVLGLEDRRAGLVLAKVQRGLLRRYGLAMRGSGRLEGEECQRLELVKSLESVKRNEADLELLLCAIRARISSDRLDPDAAEMLERAVGMKTKLARQRDGLIMKMRAESRADKKLDGGTEEYSGIAVTIVGGDGA